MTILSYQSILSRAHTPTGAPDHIEINPFEKNSKEAFGLSYGLGPAGYDIRIGKIDRWPKLRTDDVVKLRAELERIERGEPAVRAERWSVSPGEFLLLSAMEYIEIPNDLLVRVADKSSLARQGLAVQNTVIEPGWKGYLTLELTNHSRQACLIEVGQPIAQLIFEELDKPTQRPYRGKYQDQPNQPIHAIHAIRKEEDK